MTSIAKNIEQIMQDNGLDKVKIYHDNSSNVVVQGNLDHTYSLTFKNANHEDIKQYEHYVVLKNKKNQRTITIWKQVNIQNFQAIIKSAKIYTGLNSENTKKSHRSLMIPVTLMIGIIMCGVTGIFLGNIIRNICFQHKIEQVEILENK